MLMRTSTVTAGSYVIIIIFKRSPQRRRAGEERKENNKEQKILLLCVSLRSLRLSGKKNHLFGFTFQLNDSSMMDMRVHPSMA